MSTKWKYATYPAETRLNMLREGNDELYKEEIARTNDVISARLAQGVDVSDQMKWADTVSYNYNLGKAAAMGIDSSNVAKDGYADRLFGNKTESVGKNVSTIKSPAKLTSDEPYYKQPTGRSSENLHQSIIDSYVKGINERGRILQTQANDYIKSLNEDYEKQIAEVKKAYEKKNKYRKEALLNEGANEGGGRVLSEEIRSEDEYRDLLESLKNERDKNIKNIRTSLMESLYSLSNDMMSKASDEYYRYNALLSDEKQAEYEKSRDAVADEKWNKEFDYQKETDAKDRAEREKNFEYEKSLADREYAMREAENAAEHEKWYKEFEQDSKNSEREYAIDSAKIGLEKEKFNYEKLLNEKEDEAKNEKEQPLYGEKYEQCLAYAKKVSKYIVKTADGKSYEPKYTRDEIIKLVYSFDLTSEEKKTICKEIGVFS